MPYAVYIKEPGLVLTCADMEPKVLEALSAAMGSKNADRMIVELPMLTAAKPFVTRASNVMAYRWVEPSEIERQREAKAKADEAERRLVRAAPQRLIPGGRS